MLPKQMLQISDRAWRIGAARAHVLGWASYCDPTYQRPRHIKVLGEHLMLVEQGVIDRLMVFMPPRHGKSETTTVKFPSWYLGRHPDRRGIIASHTASLAARFSMRGRNDFDQYAPEVWGLRVQPDVAAMYRWDVLDPNAPPGQPPGGLIAAGIGGPITGQGAHLAVIDDPFKGAEDANSKVQRDAVWDWYRFVLRTRLMPGGAIVLVLTRWHEDDLAGRLLQAASDDPGADQWTVLNLPALAEDDDPLGRPPGKALWPEQYSEADLQATRASVGPYVWAALFQQRPQPAGGSVFRREWFRYFREEGDLYRLDAERTVRQSDCLRFATVDLAVSTKESADYTVLGIWAMTPKRDLLLLDIVRLRVEGADHLALLWRIHERWRPAYIGIERVAYQLALIQAAQRDGLPVRELKADRDKVSRALPAAVRMEAGAVWFRSGAPWLGDLEDELLMFPKGEHDDQVDVLGYAALALTQHEPPVDARIKRLLGGASLYG